MKVHEVLEIARKQLGEVFPDSMVPELRLEGVEKSVDGHFWEVMFSLPRQGIAQSRSFAAIEP